MDLSAANDTVNHQLLLKKAYDLTKNFGFVELLRSMLEDHRFYVILLDKNSRWRIQKEGLAQGSVMAPTLFNVYKNYQPIGEETQPFYMPMISL